MQPNVSRSTLRPLSPFTALERGEHLGRFRVRPCPTNDNPEKFVVIGDWARKNLVQIALPAPIAAAEGADCAWFHRLVAPRFLELVDAWTEAGVVGDVIQWGGSYASRYIRGSRNKLSMHAFGAAFDINVPWNRLGHEPAPLGAQGSVLRLVDIAAEVGFCWGGSFRRCDGMHFEIARF